MKGIEGLRKLYADVDFKKGNNEAQLHELFEESPWLIDPTFTQFLTSDDPEGELNKRLAKHLRIGKYTPEGYDPKVKDEKEPLGSNKRPDLVFLLSNEGLLRLIIVELKAPNTPLHRGHLEQLEGYMQRAEEWLKRQGGEKKLYKVEGYLIGSKAEPKMTSDKVAALEYAIENYEHKSKWSIFDIGDILDRTKKAHQKLLEIYNRAARSGDPDDSEPE